MAWNIRAFEFLFDQKRGMPGMANHASALKAHRQNLKHRSINRSNRSSLRTLLKKFDDRLKAGQAEEAKGSLSEVYAAIDRSQQKKAISKNAAARQKSRLTRRLNTALTASQSV